MRAEHLIGELARFALGDALPTVRPIEVDLYGNAATGATASNSDLRPLTASDRCSRTHESLQLAPTTGLFDSAGRRGTGAFVGAASCGQITGTGLIRDIAR